MVMDAATIAAILGQMQGRRALVIGDVMLDQFVDGEVKRISPEAPVPVLGKTNVRQMPGGAANVACNLVRLGLNVSLIGVIGNDDAGQSLTTEMTSLSAIAFTPIVADDRPTSLKTRFRANGQQILRVDDESLAPITDTQSAQILEAAKSQLGAADVMVLSDYAKGCLSPSLLGDLTKAAKDHGVKVVADPKRADLSAYQSVDLLTPNLAELRLACGREIDTLGDITAVSATIASEHNISAILATLSARGMLLVTNDGGALHAPATARDVFDVSGAGDTVIAALAGVYAAGVDAVEGIMLANIAAGVAVGKSGTAVVSPGEIIAQIAPLTPDTSVAYNAELCAKWRDSGQKIGFANGCFDLLHPGHMYLLHAARQKCDKLIVGLNSDASVKRLKGASRPSQNAELRAAILAALPDVDAVAIFGKDTPLDLVTALQPDVIIKGGDYAPEDVVGGDIVRARGGTVEIIDTLGSHSTSAIISA